MEEKVLQVIHDYDAAHPGGDRRRARLRSAKPRKLRNAREEQPMPCAVVRRSNEGIE
jgi:hypothetical protein